MNICPKIIDLPAWMRMNPENTTVNTTKQDEDNFDEKFLGGFVPTK